MSISLRVIAAAFSIFSFAACQSHDSKKAENATKADTVSSGIAEQVNLPAPYATKSAEVYCDVIPWPADKTPTAPEGFTVTRFADSLENPRWIYTAPNGDVFVSEATSQTSVVKEVKDKLSGKAKSGNTTQSPNKIILLRDTNHDGVADFKSTFMSGLHQPFGMLIMDGSFYVANTDGVLQFPYQPGQDKISGTGKLIVKLPAGGYNNHWTRNLHASKDGKRILITVGSGSNVAEHGMDNEVRRANILEVNPDGTGEKIYAGGLRNPQGMGYAPGSEVLYTAVNERDELGDELVPDYLTSVKEGGFYGWPYSYWGSHEDPRMKDKQRPDLVKTAIVPDVSLGAHTASLGLAFDDKKSFTGKYEGGAFIGQHGSWNRSHLSGYKVVFVPFSKGRPSGPMQDFLTGFIADEKNLKVYGRPVGVAFSQNGFLLVADDAGNTIWCVKADKK